MSDVAVVLGVEQDERAGDDAEILTSNPAARLKPGGGSASHERHLTRSEFDAALEHVEGECRLMAQLLVGTGMRWSEAAGFHRSRCDRMRGIAEVSEVWGAKTRRVEPYPKGKSRRHVPIPDWGELGDVYELDGHCWYPHTEGRCPSPLAITTVNGSVLDATRFRTAWNAACDAAGIVHVRVHDPRHAYASWLLQSGISPARVGRLLGHVSPLTTERYAYLDETSADDVLAVLGARSTSRPQPEPEPASVEADGPRLRVVR